MQNGKLKTGRRPLGMNVCTRKRSGLNFFLLGATFVLCLSLRCDTSIIYFLRLHFSILLQHFTVILMPMKKYTNLLLTGELAPDKPSTEPPKNSTFVFMRACMVGVPGEDTKTPFYLLATGSSHLHCSRAWTLHWAHLQAQLVLGVMAR